MPNFTLCSFYCFVLLLSGWAATAIIPSGYLPEQEKSGYNNALQYEKSSESIAAALGNDNYIYLFKLLTEHKAYIIIQESVLLIREKKYVDAGNRLNQSLSAAKEYLFHNLSNIYGKKAEQYNSINNTGEIELPDEQNGYKKIELELKNEKNFSFFLTVLLVVITLLLVLSFILYFINKRRGKLMEGENERIHQQIESLTLEIEEQSSYRLDLSKFNLTDRQIQIIHLIREGKINKEIARELYVSENTIKYHLKVIYEILHIEHRNELKK